MRLAAAAPNSSTIGGAGTSVGSPGLPEVPLDDPLLDPLLLPLDDPLLDPLLLPLDVVPFDVVPFPVVPLLVQ